MTRSFSCVNRLSFWDVFFFFFCIISFCNIHREQFISLSLKSPFAEEKIEFGFDSSFGTIFFIHLLSSNLCTFEFPFKHTLLDTCGFDEPNVIYTLDLSNLNKIRSFDFISFTISLNMKSVLHTKNSFSFCIWTIYFVFSSKKKNSAENNADENFKK